jgi:hypothetical protein
MTKSLKNGAAAVLTTALLTSLLWLVLLSLGGEDDPPSPSSSSTSMVPFEAPSLQSAQQAQQTTPAFEMPPPALGQTELPPAYLREVASDLVALIRACDELSSDLNVPAPATASLRAKAQEIFATLKSAGADVPRLQSEARSLRAEIIQTRIDFLPPE